MTSDDGVGSIRLMGRFWVKRYKRLWFSEDNRIRLRQTYHSR